ncbi:hypothetical protein, partial [Klebsiella pneumoniae]
TLMSFYWNHRSPLTIFSHQASPPRLRPWRHPVLLSRFAAVFYAILGQESPLCSLFGGTAEFGKNRTLS